MAEDNVPVKTGQTLGSFNLQGFSPRVCVLQWFVAARPRPRHTGNGRVCSSVFKMSSHWSIMGRTVHRSDITRSNHSLVVTSDLCGGRPLVLESRPARLSFPARDPSV